MRVFHAMVLVGLIAIISLGGVFSNAIFLSVYEEGGETYEGATLIAHYQITAWITVITALLIVALLVVAFKLWF